MVLRGLQSLLGTLYDVELHYDVYDYLVTDRTLLDKHPAVNDRRVLEEELLLAEGAEGVDGAGVAGVALFLDADLIARLEKADPVGSLDENNLADYCTALEGVSHFVYSTWRLERDLPLSLLELETQAEVDKYALTVFLLKYQLGGTYPSQVHARLFDRVSFDTRLEPAQRERYHMAHRSAARFCRRLEQRFVNRGVARIEGMLRELRKFYRLRSTAKLSYALS